LTEIPIPINRLAACCLLSREIAEHTPGPSFQVFIGSNDSGSERVPHTRHGYLLIDHQLKIWQE